MEVENQAIELYKNDSFIVKTEFSSPNSKKRKKGFKGGEGVCFHCFDSNGELVPCSRKDCQKVYHRACIGSENPNLKNWQCSWHICDNCEKAAQYMCYTCHNSLCKICIKESNSLCKLCFKESNSLCKTCIKESNFLRVNGSKGFCKICIGRVVQCENNERGCQDIFRSYWNTVKSKLKQNERTEIISRFKGSIPSVCKEKPDSQLDDPSNDQVSNSGSSSDNLEEGSSKRRKVIRCTDLSDRTSRNEGISILCDTEWACNELLDFVALIKNGDTSFLSHFDVRALLIEYIKRNNLRDPRHQNQINCDQRLTALFGKACIKHFEMLKYLGSHLLKNDSKAIQARAVERNPSQVKTVDHKTSQRELAENRFGKICKTSEQKLPQAVSGYAAVDSHPPTGDISKPSKRETGYKGSKLYESLERRLLQTNTDDYASVDAHNINLLYLKRDLLEDMLEDIDEKVIGSFVRITIPSKEKPERYRLVKVVGIREARKPYSVGEKKTNIMLEISSLSETESLRIDSVSDQDFSEDECNCLRERIRSGLDSQMTVREVQKTVLDLQEVRVNFLLEKEKLALRNRCDHLGQRKGHKKEQQKLIMQCQQLSSSEERLRRMEEIPEIHSDPDMNLINKAQVDAKSDYIRDNCMQQTNIGLHSEELNTYMVEKNLMTALESSTNMVDISNGFGQKTDEPLFKQDEVQESPVVHADLDMNPSNKAQDDAKSDDTRQDNYMSQTVVPNGFGEQIDELSWKQIEVQEILDVHADPDLNPVNKAQGDANSDDNRQDKDNYMRQIDIGIHGVDKKPDTNIVEKYSMTVVEPSTDMVDEPSSKQDEYKNPVVASVLDLGTSKGQVLAGSESISRSLTASFVRKTDKLWHYEDPSGNIQGPFSMLQLCKWSTTSSFPANMRVWKKKGNPEDSILLTDALNNTFSHPPRVPAIDQCDRVHNVIDECDVETPLTTSSSVTVKPMEDLNSSGAFCNPLRRQLASSPKANCGDLHAVFRADVLDFQMKAEYSSSTSLEVDDHDTAEEASQSVQPMEILHGAGGSCASEPNLPAQLQSIACDLSQQDVSITYSNNPAFVGEGITDMVEDFKDDLSNLQLTDNCDRGIFVNNELTSLSTSSPVLVKPEEETNGCDDLLLSCPVVTNQDNISPSNDLSPDTYFENGIGTLIEDKKTNAVKSQQSSSPKADCDDCVVTSPMDSQGMTYCPPARSGVEGETIVPCDDSVSVSVETQGFVECPQPALDGTLMDINLSKGDFPFANHENKLTKDNQEWNSLVDNSAREAPHNKKSLHVGKLHPDVDEKILHETFIAFGAFMTAPKIVRDEIGNSRGYGYINYDSIDSCDAAIEAMHNKYLLGRRIRVSYSYNNWKDSEGEYHATSAQRVLSATKKTPEGGILQRNNDGLPQGGRILYVGNLDYGVDEERLRDRFGEFGAIVELRIIRNCDNRCYGFITYDSIDTARRALEATNGKCLLFRQMKVQYAKGEPHSTLKEKTTEWGSCQENSDLSPNLESGFENFIQDCKTDVINAQDWVVASPPVCKEVSDGPSARYEVDGEKIVPIDSSASASIETQGFPTNTRSLFVGHLNSNVDEKVLGDRFSEFGAVRKATVKRDRDTGASRGFGFITYDSIDTAHRAKEGTHNQLLLGRQMIVDYAYEEPHGTPEKAPERGSCQLNNDGGHQEDRRDSREGHSNRYVRGGGGGRGYGGGSNRGGGWGSERGYTSGRKGVDSYGSRGRGDFNGGDRGRGRGGFNRRGGSSSYAYGGGDSGSWNTSGILGRGGCNKPS